MPDDASRSPGMGVRHIEQALPTGESRRQPVLRSSPGTGSLVDRRRPPGDRSREAARRALPAGGEA